MSELCEIVKSTYEVVNTTAPIISGKTATLIACAWYFGPMAVMGLAIGGIEYMINHVSTPKLDWHDDF